MHRVASVRAASPLVGEADTSAQSAEGSGEGGRINLRGWRCHPHPILRRHEASTSPSRERSELERSREPKCDSPVFKAA